MQDKLPTCCSISTVPLRMILEWRKKLNLSIIDFCWSVWDLKSGPWFPDLKHKHRWTLCVTLTLLLKRISLGQLKIKLKSQWTKYKMKQNKNNYSTGVSHSLSSRSSFVFSKKLFLVDASFSNLPPSWTHTVFTFNWIATQVSTQLLLCLILKSFYANLWDWMKELHQAKA